MSTPPRESAQEPRTHGGKRPAWLDAWLDYPHGSMSERHARELAWYAQKLADDRLKNAAPDLLEALKGVLRIADRKTDEFDAARAAIAKATEVTR